MEKPTNKGERMEWDEILLEAQIGEALKQVSSRAVDNLQKTCEILAHPNTERKALFIWLSSFLVNMHPAVGTTALGVAVSSVLARNLPNFVKNIKGAIERRNTSLQ